MRRVAVPVPLTETKQLALAYLCSHGFSELAKASAVADAIWPEKPFCTGQGAGAAASRILKAMTKDGTAEWYSDGEDWGYRATSKGRREM